MNYHQEPCIYVKNLELKITDIERSLDYYKSVIGFRVLEREEKKAVLTADGKTPLLTLIEPDGVSPKEPHRTGLYHFALLLPNRSDLADFLASLLNLKIRIGASDHHVSEAIYLQDPDDNGIEVYTDRDDSGWVWKNKEVHMTTEPLNARNLLEDGTEEGWRGLPAGTTMGHIHLHVGDLAAAERFYCEGLGFEVATRYGEQALFISSGGYHHHIGLNVWNGQNIPAASPNSAGLKFYTIVYPSDKEKEEVILRLKGLGEEVKKLEDVYEIIDPFGMAIHLI
ncbi:VOC family protein [Pradoshia sp.]